MLVSRNNNLIRRGHHIVSVAVINAVGVNSDGRYEGHGMTMGDIAGWEVHVKFTLDRQGELPRISFKRNQP